MLLFCIRHFELLVSNARSTQPQPGWTRHCMWHPLRAEGSHLPLRVHGRVRLHQRLHRVQQPSIVLLVCQPVISLPSPLFLIHLPPLLDIFPLDSSRRGSRTTRRTARHDTKGPLWRAACRFPRMEAQNNQPTPDTSSRGLLGYPHLRTPHVRDSISHGCLAALALRVERVPKGVSCAFVSSLHTVPRVCIRSPSVKFAHES